MTEKTKKPAPKKRSAPKKRLYPKKKTRVNVNETIFSGLNLSKDQILVLTEFFSGSRNWAEVSEKTGIPHSTIHNWKRIPMGPFNHAIERHRSLNFEMLHDVTIKNVNGASVCLSDWLQSLRKKKGDLDPSEAKILIQFLSITGGIQKIDNSSKADLDKKRQTILSGLEALIEEKITEEMMTRE
jgi:hypothetical protein